MAGHSADFGDIEPQEIWQASPSAVQELLQWDLPKSTGAHERFADQRDDVGSNDPSQDALWAMEGCGLQSSPQIIERCTQDLAPPDIIPADGGCIDPQDIWLNPDYGTMRRVPAAELHRTAAKRDHSSAVTQISDTAAQTSTHIGLVTQGDTAVSTHCDDIKVPRRKKQRRTRLTRDAIDRFKIWFEEHKHYPYPTKDDVITLAEETNTTAKQVKSWFSNARTRYGHDMKPAITESAGASHQQCLTVTALQTWSNTSGSPRSGDSLRRLLDVSVVNADCLTSDTAADLASAVQGSEEAASSQADEELPPWLAEAADNSQSTAPSVSGSDQFSAFSSVSLVSMNSAVSGHTSFASSSANGGSRRRGKRRFDQLNSVSETSLSVGCLPCTFCGKVFAAPYDWKRHEATHVPFVSQWTCMPDNIAIDDDGECVFCFAPDVDEAHMQLHRVAGCKQKPLGQRTFGRKDQLKQHIELCHLNKAQAADSHMLSKFLGQWQRDANLTWDNEEHKPALWCGFCFTHSHSWKQRQDHVLEHLRGRDNTGRWVTYPEFTAYCEKNWDERLAGTYQKYSDYVDHLIARLKADSG